MKYITLVFWASLVSASTCFAQVRTDENKSTYSTDTHVFTYTNPITRETTLSLRDIKGPTWTKQIIRY